MLILLLFDTQDSKFLTWTLFSLYLFDKFYI